MFSNAYKVIWYFNNAAVYMKLLTSRFILGSYSNSYKNAVANLLFKFEGENLKFSFETAVPFF